jgi:hypothetical protein
VTAEQNHVIWQRRDCALWCVREHRHLDSGQENRACTTDPEPMPIKPPGIGMSLWKADTSTDGIVYLPTINVSLEQMPLEAEPRVVVSSEAGMSELTITEAESLRALLGERIDQAKRGMEAISRW